MISKLSTSTRVTEVGDVAKRLSVLFAKTDKLHDDKFIAATINEITVMGDRLTEEVCRDSVMSKLKELDLHRDNALRVLGKLVEAYNVIPVDTIRIEGKKLYTVFKKYGTKITKASYSEESNLIESLMKDLSADNIFSILPQLPGVNEAINNLRYEQDKFAEFRSEYEHTMSTQAAADKASSISKPLIALINGKLLTYLDAMCVSSPKKYKSFADNCSQIIDSINSAVKGRSKKGIRSKDKKEKETAKEAEKSVEVSKD